VFAGCWKMGKIWGPIGDKHAPDYFECKVRKNLEPVGLKPAQAGRHHGTESGRSPATGPGDVEAEVRGAVARRSGRRRGLAGQAAELRPSPRSTGRGARF